MFTISVDRTRRLVELKLIGLMDLAEVAALQEALVAELADSGLRPGRFVQLNDGSEFPIQSQEVYAALSRLAKDKDILPRKLALVSGDSPGRMQARRLTAGCESRLFDSRSEALRWLLADLPADALSARSIARALPAAEHRSAA